MEREEIVSQLGGIKLKNINLTGITLPDEFQKKYEEDNEFMEALLMYLTTNKDPMAKEHLLEEFCDTIQVRLSIMKILGIDIEEITEHWNTKHLEKLKLRPREKGTE